MIQTNIPEHGVKIPSDRIWDFFGEHDGDLQTKWFHRCLDQGYGSVHAARGCIFFQSIESAIQFKLTYL